MTRLSRELAAHLVLCVCAVAGALALLAGLLHFNGLWIDELYSLHAIRLSFAEMVVERLRRGHFPLYFALLKCCVAAWGAVSEASLRVPSIVLWLAAVVSFAALAPRVLSGPAAVFAVTLFALNGLVIRQAAEARMYTMVLLEAVWITRAYIEVIAHPDRRAWKAGFIVLCVAALWTSTSSMIVLVAFVFDAWRRRTRGDTAIFGTTLAAAIAGALSLVPGIVLHFAIRQQGEVAKTNPLFMGHHVVSYFAGIAGCEDYYDATRLLMALQAAGAAVTFVVLHKLWRHKAGLPAAVGSCARIVLFPLAAMVVTWAVNGILNTGISLLGPARYLIGMTPCAAVLVAYMLMGPGGAGQRGQGMRLLLHGAYAAFLLAGVYAILTVPCEPFRYYAEQLRERRRPGDGVVTVPDEIADGVEMYVPGVRVDAAINRWIVDEALLRQMLRPVADRGQVWLLWYRGRQPKPVEVAEQMLGPYESSSRKKNLGTLRLLRFEPGGRRQ